MAESRPRRCKRSPEWTREQGREHLEAQAGSGLSVQDYCFAYGIETHTFYNWRRRFKQVTLGPGGDAVESRVLSGPAFAEVVVSSPESAPPSSVVEVVLQGDRRLRVGPDFDEDALLRLVSLLESLPC